MLNRWDNYVLTSGPEAAEFWRGHLAAHAERVLCVIGKGFDPRMSDGVKLLIECGAGDRLDVLAIVHDEGIGSPSLEHKDAVEANWRELEALVESAGAKLRTFDVPMWREQRRVGARAVVEALPNYAYLAGYADVVIDVGALPRTLYFPLIAKALKLVDDGAGGNDGPDVHVFVPEDVSLDQRIRGENIDERAEYLYPFAARVAREDVADAPRVWLPLLGKDRRTQFERIRDLVNPDEIVPVLPSPARNPRRGDDLVLEYRDLLFDQAPMNPSSFVYAAERNPFEVYRQIKQTVIQYTEALSPVGEAAVIISVLSSKLMAVGALLATYELFEAEHTVGIAQAEPFGYRLAASSGDADGEGDRSPRNPSPIFSLWIAGACYRSD